MDLDLATPDIREVNARACESPSMLAPQLNVVRDAIGELFDGIIASLPDLLAGGIFLVIAAVIVTLLTRLVRAALGRALPGESPVYRQFLTTIVAAFLWFGVVLSFLTVVGLPHIATSLGTATGFLALGVAYALSEMIEDAVAGVYLLRDPDFMPGDTVTVGETTGTVQVIELRKTRLAVGEDTVIRANAEIEKQWTKKGSSPTGSIGEQPV